MIGRGMTRNEFEVKDREEIIKILDESKVLHLGMVDGTEPYVIPMNYGYTMEDGSLTLYLHGAPKGRKWDVIRANPNVFFEMCCELIPFEGRVACQNGMSYYCLMGGGEAEILEDVEEKKRCLSILMKTQTNRDFTFDDRLIGIVNVIRIQVKDYTAKHRPLPQNREAMVKKEREEQGIQ